MIGFYATGGKSSDDKSTELRFGAGKIGMAAVAVSFLFGAVTANAKTVYVNSAVATSGNGSSWGSAYKYLRDALDNSAGTDQIFVAKGTYYPDDGASGDFGNREKFFELKGQKVYGGFAGTEKTVNERNIEANLTVLSGEIWQLPGDDVYWSMHVIVMAENSTLDGLTVEKGHASGADSWNYPRITSYDEGGGCYVAAGKTLTLRGVNFRNNRSLSFGGAIMVADDTGKVVATDCVFEDNSITPIYSVTTSVPAGGAIRGKVEATNCSFINNSVYAENYIGSETSLAAGGAIFGDVTANNCQFIDNTVSALSPTPVAQGGAIAGSVKAVRCTFDGNVSEVESNGDPGPDPLKPKTYISISYGGAIFGGSVDATNCAFTANESDIGVIEKDGSGSGGGGAIYISTGNSKITNSTFVENTSRVRGGAIHSATTANTDSLIVADCTFLDNGIATGFKGAAISCGGIVRVLNNIFWNSAATAGDFSQVNFIHVIKDGVLRNTDVNYPTPATVALNIAKASGGANETSITKGGGGDLFIGNLASTILRGDPLFVNIADPVGLDGLWGTSDDGLRLGTGSAAIVVAQDPRLISTHNFLPSDSFDLDEDGNVTELIPLDLGSYVRVQGPFVDLGAYESGDTLNVPDIVVEYPVNTNLVDGTSEVDLSVSPGVEATFVIKNNGTRDLKNLVLTGDGVDIANFVYTQPIAKTVAVGSSTTFTVTFNPTTPVVRNAVIHVASNDPDEKPFDIKLRGETLYPDIALEQPSPTNLVDAVSTVDFGTIAAEPSASRIFTIRNTGEANLNITGITFSGTNAADFRSSTPQNVIAPGASVDFSVTLSPGANGVRTAAMTVLSNDPDAESSFLVNLTGFAVLTPDIAVYQPATTNLPDGVLSAFGSVIKGQTYTKTFTIRNEGSGPLNGIAFSLTGSDRFSFVKAPVTRLAAGASTTFKISFKPSGTGKKTAKLIIASDDTDEAQFDINLSGTGVLNVATKKKTSFAAAASEVFSTPSFASQSGGAATTVVTENGAKYLVLTVQKTADWSSSKHSVEVSSDLLDWYSGSNHTTILVNTPAVLSVRDNTPIKPDAKRYIRLK